ncbi:hypothetical protein M407DRAFT_247185 [Tulasnella calospora MUT 4182]|uniref:Uncharacterized protein n=1 Tax=Tulasnella calospora MUT 4182 TaxID=1051891 RepID=A0A0C3L1J6_9AGAM|nr:hypothetical protein M407DRAFT_247185 [Tulasnella calospora MUT 4182]
MSATTAQPPDFTFTPDPAQTQQPPQGPSTGPIYLYAFTLIAFLICIIACCSAWRGVVIRRRRREMGLPELEEWGMGDHDAFGRRLKEQEPVDPPMMYEVYLEDGKAEGGRWYWGQEKGKVDDGIWSTKMPISTSVVPVTDQPPNEPEADPTLGITTFSALAELSPHRWKLFKRFHNRRQKTPPTSSLPLSVDPPPPPPSPRKVVTSILIAMPAPHHAQSERQPSVAMSEGTLVFEDEFPEVLFGVYEGAWAAHQPTMTSSAPPLNHDAASRV